MSASVAVKKETQVSLTTQREGDMSETTSERSTSSSMTVQQETSAFPSTQGQWTFVTTQSSPTKLTEKINPKHENLVVIAGNSVSLHCTSSADVTFHWKYWLPGSQESMLFYNGDRVNRKFQRIASLSAGNCGTRNCTLTVFNFQLRDTHTFACLGGNVNNYWSFTVLREYRK